jgi:hypothetical protein
MTIDIYETRTMMAPLTVNTSPRTFLLNTFFPAMKEFNTIHVDMDYTKRNRRKAAYVRRREQGQPVDATGFTTKQMVPPYVKPFITTDADEDLKRSPGEVIYTNVSPQVRAAQKVTSDLMEVDDMITRAEEFQATQFLENDLVEIHDADDNEIAVDISYGRLLTHDITLAGADLWTNAASRPFTNLKTWKVLIGRDAGVAASDVVMGATAADAFLNNVNVQAKLDLIRAYPSVQVDVVERQFGVIWLGKYFGMDLWQYDEWYWNGTTDVNYMPADKIYMGSRSGGGIRLYGAIRHLKAGTRMARRFPWTYTNDAEDERFVQIHSAPLIFPANPDSTLVAQVTT